MSLPFFCLVFATMGHTSRYRVLVGDYLEKKLKGLPIEPLFLVRLMKKFVH